MLMILKKVTSETGFAPCITFKTFKASANDLSEINKKLDLNHAV